MDPWLGEIRLFAGTFAPYGWALCNGQLLSVQQNSALFSLLGTSYGGDGITAFGLPNLQSRVPIHRDVFHQLGETGGAESVTLLESQMPQHSHAMQVSTTPATTRSTTGTVPAALPSDAAWTSNPANEARGTTTPAGGSQPHLNIQPSLGIVHIICIDGLFPQRP